MTSILDIGLAGSTIIKSSASPVVSPIRNCCKFAIIESTCIGSCGELLFFPSLLK